jgi:hypothetical protein
MIDDQQRLIFIENPKTASSSLRRALMGPDYLSNFNDPRIATIGHHIPRVLKVKYPDKWRDYTSMVVIRNTWDRAHSYFTYTRDYSGANSYKQYSFDEWVKEYCPAASEDHIRASLHRNGLIENVLDQLPYIEDVNEVITMDSFDRDVRVAQLNKGLERIRSKYDIKTDVIPENENNQGRTEKVIQWKQETVDRLYEQYHKEIDMFGFKPPKVYLSDS